MIKMKMTKAGVLNAFFKEYVRDTVVENAIRESEYRFPLGEHIKLWDWLVDNPGKTKGEYFRTAYRGDGIPKCHCFACEFSNDITSYIDERYDKKIFNYITQDLNYIGCLACPFACDAENGCLDGIFDDWDDCTDMYLDEEDDEHIADMAEMIRDFPVKDFIADYLD